MRERERGGRGREYTNIDLNDAGARAANVPKVVVSEALVVWIRAAHVIG